MTVVTSAMSFYDCGHQCHLHRTAISDSSTNARSVTIHHVISHCRKSYGPGLNSWGRWAQKGRDEGKKEGEGGRKEGGGGGKERRVVVMVEGGDWEGAARGVRLAGKERGPNGN